MYFHFRLPETPARELNPNSTAHWGTKATKVKKARSFPNRHNIVWTGDWPNEPTNVTWLISWEPGHQKLDYDNMLGSMKPYQDGLADLLGINDRLITGHVLPQQRDIEKEGFILCFVSTGAPDTVSGKD